jgi:phenylacetate-CoA ligase
LSWRMQQWWGIDPWEDVARIDRGVRDFKETLIGAARWWPTRRLYLQLWQVDEASVRKFASTCSSVRPVMLEGQVAPLFEVAELVAAAGISFPPLRAVGVTASQLMPSVRARLEEVFGAPVYDQYRCAEVPFLAGECGQQNGLHIFSDYRFIEIVDEAGRPVPDGEEGEVVVTDLSNRVFPVIRYKLGDRARLRTEACPCGITLPLMGSPAGRANEVLRLPDHKTLVSGLNNAFWDRPDAARQYQIHQRADYSIVLRVIPGEALDYRVVTDQVAEMIRTRCKNQVPVSIEYVERIEAVNGKFSYVISDV